MFLLHGLSTARIKTSKKHDDKFTVHVIGAFHLNYKTMGMDFIIEDNINCGARKPILCENFSLFYFYSIYLFFE